MVKDRSNWLPVSIAPFDTDLEVLVIEKEEVHRLMFPCRRTTSGWADTMARRLKIDPSHWRRWKTCELRKLERISAGLNRDSPEDLDRRISWH